jgi:signal transduction histidine kinase
MIELVAAVCHFLPRDNDALSLQAAPFRNRDCVHCNSHGDAGNEVRLKLREDIQKLSRRKISLRLGLAYLTGVLLFVAAAYLTFHVFSLVTTETDAIVSEDEVMIRMLRQELLLIDEAVKASRFAAAGQVTLSEAQLKRATADQSLNDVRQKLLPEERPLFESLESSWKTAVGLLEKMEQQQGRAGTIFQNELLPILTTLGQTLQKMESLRRERSFNRVETLQRMTRLTRFQLLFFLLPLILIGIGLAWSLQRYILRPLRALGTAADDVARGHFDRRVAVQRNDEMGDLIRHFNFMVQQLAEADRLKKEFASMVSHEMRTPLTVLRIYSSLLYHTPEAASEKEKARAVEFIHRETLNLQALTDDLFDVARAQAGAFRIAPYPADLAAELAAFLKPFEKQAEEKNIAFQWDVSALPNAVVDVKRLGQAVRNLMTNALKFAPTGGRVEVTGELREGHILLEVRDSGPGIPLDDQPHVFTRFYQVKPREGSGRGGTGLGLAVVREIALAHGGRAEVISKEGQPTCFRIVIPFIAPKEPGARSEDE